MNRRRRRSRRRCGIRPLTARLLVARGIAEADLAARFLAPRLADLRPPDGMADLPRALDRLAAALAAGETIGVFGDYDVDGVTTAAVLTSALRALRRHGGARGPRAATPATAWASPTSTRFAGDGCRVLVTGDCGTSDHDALRGGARARHRRDRHRPPRAARGRDRGVRAGQLAPPRRRLPVQGAGVVRRRVLPGGGAAHAARRRRSIRATCSTWWRWGRSPTWCRWSTRTGSWSPPGCSGCRSASGPGWRRWRRAPSWTAGRITAHDVAFRLTPRLNAAGRLGEAQLALDLLLAGAADAERLAGELDDQNTERQRIQELVWKEALAQATAQVEETDAAAMVVGAEGWHPGVVGIIAARLVDRFARPAIAIGFRDGEGRGSARTVAGVNLFDALARCAGAPDQVRRSRRRGRA